MGSQIVKSSFVNEHWRLVLAVIVFIVWLIVVSGVFWWYQFRHISSIDDYWASFSGESFIKTKIAPNKGDALIVHMVDPKCPCSRFAVSHIAELESKYANQAEFININAIAADDKRRGYLNNLVIPASPAVAIWDKFGELAYFGPYSGGRFCGEGLDFVSTTLSSLSEAFNPRWINQEAVGCFCQWSKPV